MLISTHREIDVFVTPEAESKMQALVDENRGEVGWFGLVDEVTDHMGNKRDRVYDVLVPRQEVSLGSVDHEGPDIGAFLEEYEEYASQMKFYGHSHVHGVCRPSWIDLEQIDRWEQYDMPYMISHIRNKMGEHYTRIDQFHPRRLVTKVNFRLEIPEDSREWAEHETFKHVHELSNQELKQRRGSYVID